MSTGDAASGVSLAERLEGVISWVDRHLHAFDPFLDGRPYRATMGQRSSELAVALYVHAARLPGERNRIASLVEFLDGLRKRPEFSHRVLRNPAEFVLNADVYGLLRLLGWDDPGHRALVQRAVDAGFLDHVERHPHRELDVRLALEWAGVDHPWPSIHEIVSRSPLVRGRPSSLFLDESAIYALTHIVMFATDFGLAGETYCDAETLAPIAAQVPTLLVVACADRHWDLVGELLICHEALALPRDEGWRQAWDAFLAQQLPDGAFPGPESALDPPDADPPMSGEDRERAAIAHHYHTTLIAWIALAGRIHDESAGKGHELTPIRKPGGVAAGAGHSSRRGDPARPGPRRRSPPAPLRSTGERDGRGESPGRNPAGGDLSRMATRTAGWLQESLDRLEWSGPTVGEACSLVMGLSLCDHLAGGVVVPERVFRQAGRVIQAAATSLDPGVEAGVSTRLMASAVLLSRGIELPDYLGLLPALVSLLQEEDGRDGSQQEDPAFQEARGLVSALGLCAPPRAPGERELRCDFEASLVTRGRTERLRLLRRVEAATGWGTRPLPDPAWFQPHLPVLQALATASLRQFDLELGCRTLRAVKLLDPRSDTDPWLDYLLFQGRPDGAFGFFGPEVRNLPDPDTAGETLRMLEVATTVACLWTVAELSDVEWSFPACLAKGIS